MILVGSQRAGAKALAKHLLKEENDHVEVHELRGFASDDLTDALNEAHAISRGTRCKQYLYSLSFNPPPGEDVPTSAFEDAIGRAEQRLGLIDQPRAIVFHEKDGRRHCHVVWSRIDADEMKAIPLPFTKQKLQELSRELYLEHGWQMPRGLMKSEERDPRNFTLAEWQQAKRIGSDPREIKTALQDCWAVSDSRQSLASALEDRGFKLARGDRRSVVAVDAQGDVYALARWAGVKTKDVRQRVGEDGDLPSVAQSKEELAGVVSTRLRELKAQQDEVHARRLSIAQRERESLIEDHRVVRRGLYEGQGVRWESETRARQERFSKGLFGLLDRLTGRHRRIQAQNEADTLLSYQRDRAERDQLIFTQIETRRAQQERIAQLEQGGSTQQKELHEDIERFESIRQEARRTLLEELRARRTSSDADVSEEDDSGDAARRANLRSLRERRSDQHATPSDEPRLEH